MKKTAGCAILILLLVFGCASMQQRSRMEKFTEITESFERALRMSEYARAAKFIDPASGASRPDLQELRNFKIADYRVTHINVSDDKLKITQDVELQYFRLNSNILHRTVYPQIWQFQPEQEIWLLQTGLPDFTPRRPRMRGMQK
jgi:hypothetical protein